MQALIVNYRRGRHVQTPNQMILKVTGVADREAASKLVGKSVSWTTPGGRKLSGKVTSAHGNSGKVLAHFEIGIPGQALGTPVELK